MKTRLFIGNLASTVTEEELRDKFTSLLSSHRDEADVGNVEVRCKNETNYFGYVDIHLNSSNNGSALPVAGGGGGKYSGVPIFLRKYVDLMNNTKWKGSLIKVQLAKESFIDKLKREQQETRKLDVPENTQERNGSQENNSEQSRNQKQANDILYKLNRSNDRRIRNRNQDQGINSKADGGDYGFEVVSSNQAASVPSKSLNKSPTKTSSPKTASKKHSKKSKSSSSEDESDDDVRDGIPKFKGLLLCYPNGIPEATPLVKEEKEKVSPTITEEQTPEETLIQQKLLSIAFEKDVRDKTRNNQPIQPFPATKSAVNFKKNKQQQSDLLRLQSIEKMKELKTQRKNVIKSALSSVTAFAPVTEQRKMLDRENDSDSDEGKSSARKKSKMTLFDDEDDENEPDNEKGDDTFKVKKQFEGAGGQKLLELKTRWGNDNRFQIDDRFKESDAEDEAEPAEQEKEKQMDILSGILGKVVGSKNDPTSAKKKGATSKEPLVIMPRYDPEADENNLDDDVDDEKMEVEKKSSKKGSKEKDKKNEPSGEGAEKTVRSTEPATFKTVSNLKSLFSSTGDDEAGKETSSTLFKAPVESQQSSFSLLATFGKSDNDKQPETTKQTSVSKSAPPVEGPRNFWQSNPFKYDSSDDEGENDSSKVKVTIKSKPENSSSTLMVHGKAPFFFTKNDARFDGLEDYFLKSEESRNANEEAIEDGAEAKKDPVEDFALKRQELKSIVKAKIRNTRRKDEKRTLAIKRALRKRKSKMQHRNRSFKKF